MLFFGKRLPNPDFLTNFAKESNYYTNINELSTQ